MQQHITTYINQEALETVVENILTHKPNLEVFSDALQQLAANDRNIVVVTSDSRGSGKLTPFAKKFPH